MGRDESGVECERGGGGGGRIEYSVSSHFFPIVLRTRPQLFLSPPPPFGLPPPSLLTSNEK